MGGLRRPHSGRNGARVDERRLSQRRRVQGAARGAESEGRSAESDTMTRSLAAALLAGSVLLSAPFDVARGQQQLPSEPQRQFGTSVTGAFEGWFTNADGSRSFLIGYLNRNSNQALDIPIGPNNRIEPGGPDMGQPTHFLPGRHWGVFTITVPADFTSPDQRLTWTLVANGQQTVIPLRLHPDYNVSPFTDLAVKNTPPVLRFAEQGPPIQGPIAMLSTVQTRTARVATPLPITLWTDD